MSEASWQTVIGVLALVVAALTLWLVILDRIERKRRIEGPRPETTGWATLPGAGGPTHRVWLENVGGGTVRIVMMRPHRFTWAMLTEPLPTVLPAGKRVPVEVQTKDFSSAWMHILWVSSEDRRFLHVDWLPLNDAGTLRDAQMTSHIARQSSLSRIPWIRRAEEAGSRVGPGGVDGRTLRQRSGGRREARFKQQLEGALRDPL